jgi:hypothetical protein
MAVVAPRKSRIAGSRTSLYLSGLYIVVMDEKRREIYDIMRSEPWRRSIGEFRAVDSETVIISFHPRREILQIINSQGSFSLVLDQLLSGGR